MFKGGSALCRKEPLVERKVDGALVFGLGLKGEVVIFWWILWLWA